MTTTAAEAVEEPAPRDDLREGILDSIRGALGDAVVGSHIRPGDDLWVRVTREAWQDAGRFAQGRLGCRYFGFLSAIDWLPSPYGRSLDSDVQKIADQAAGGEVTPDAPPAIEQGYAGGDTRFQVFARVVNITDHWGVNLKVDVGDDMTVPTWVDIYHGANWHERECWEMFGITFEGHPWLRHLYLPGAFEGYPLRKDFPLIARLVKPWPGIVDVEPMPGESEEAGDEEPAAGEER